MTLRHAALWILLIFPCVQVSSEPKYDKPINWPEGGLPLPYATPSSTNVAKVIEKPKDAQLVLPEGFVIEEYMNGFKSPRFMIEGSEGEILLTDTFAGKVYVIKNKKRHLLIKDLNNPYGLAIYKDWIYIAETTAVRRFKYNPNANLRISDGEKIVDLDEHYRGHITRTITFDPSNEKFYLSVGSRSNVDSGEAEIRAAVSRFNPDGSDYEIFAAGIRNGVGLRFYPNQTGQPQLWVSSHERDGLGDDLVPDYLSSVNKDDFFGWPYAYIGQHEDPRRAAEAPDLVARTRYPDVLLGSHVGAMDFIFYTGEQFPKKYQGGCFIAMHGSWNRSKRAGYKIAFIPFKDAKPISAPEDFISGWMLSSDSREVWGRPVGLLQMKDGSILISDDAAGVIWRVSYLK